MPIAERAKRFLASYSQRGGQGAAKRFRKLGEIEQCKIAGDVIGEMLRPDSSGHYYLTCPGVSFHGNKSGRKDCRFTPGDSGGTPRTAAPTLNCLHQSCGTVIEELNRSIRSAVGKASVEYLTDHGSMLNNAAASLVIGFGMSDIVAQKVLVTWGATCTPVHTALACGKAISAAQAAAKNKPDEVGYLLKRASAATGTAPGAAPNSPSLMKRTSFASVPSQPVEGAIATGEPIYIGIKGKVAKAARQWIEIYRSDNGCDPTILLLGPDQPDVGPKLCGLKVDRMSTNGISVCRTLADGCDG